MSGVYVAIYALSMLHNTLQPQCLQCAGLLYVSIANTRVLSYPSTLQTCLRATRLPSTRLNAGLSYLVFSKVIRRNAVPGRCGCTSHLVIDLHCAPQTLYTSDISVTMMEVKSVV